MKKHIVILPLLFVYSLVSGQLDFKTFFAGYQGFTMVNNGKIRNAEPAKYFTNSANNNPYYFQGFLIGSNGYHGGYYGETSVSWNGATVSNRDQIVEPTELFINRLRINNINYDLGYNITRNNIILTAGIGVGINTYKEKPWRYERIASEVENGILRSEYIFTKMEEIKRTVYDFRVFLNLLVGAKSTSKVVLRLKPLLIVPFQKVFFNPAAYFFGANLSVGFKK